MYYNEESVLHLDGEWLPAATAGTSVYNQGLHYGTGVFEGIRSYNVDGKANLFRGKDHMERLIFSAQAIGLPFSMKSNELLTLAYELLERNNLIEAYIRPLIYAGPMMSLSFPETSHLMLCCWPWKKLLGDQLTTLAISPYYRSHPRSCKIEAKVSGHYVNSILAATEARARGYGDALQLDIDGHVAECSGANFFYERDGILYTPHRGHILPGITRDTILQLCKKKRIDVRQQRVATFDVFGADGAFLTGTAAEVTGIASLDDHPFKKPWAETLGYVLQQEYEAATRRSDDWEPMIF
jgi:branched-chain amino acid aminotransferase